MSFMKSIMISSSFSGLFNVAKLIGCGVDELKLALSTRKMRVGNDSIVQKLTLSQVRNLSKRVNTCLVGCINHKYNIGLESQAPK